MKELKNATDDYNTSLIFDHDVGNCIWYKGSLEGRTISIRTNFYEGVEMAINEIAIASQMSAHKNALKLLECCLETRIPILVYEFPSSGFLIDRIFSPPNPLSWKSRLRIAYDIANVIAYLTLHFLGPSFIPISNPQVSFWTKIVLPNYPISRFLSLFLKVKCMWRMKFVELLDTWLLRLLSQVCTLRKMMFLVLAFFCWNF